MPPLLGEVIAGLEAGPPSMEALGSLGVPEPRRAAESLRKALDHPDLRETRDRWLPELLLTAQPGSGARCLGDLATRFRQTTGRPLDLPGSPALPRIVGNSHFLARLLLRHPNWAEETRGNPPPRPSGERIEADWTSIRLSKYRGLLRIVARDLLGRSFKENLRELTELADLCLEAALRCSSAETGVPTPALIGLGKLGGRELNFSSDVDLLFVYDPPSGQSEWEYHAGICRLVQGFKRHLEARSEDGFGYRVDLDLRPEGRTGTLANSVEAALTYYETFGADWERQMLLRARRIAGPAAPGQAFLDGVRPFVYRRLIDPLAIQGVREMKMRIEADRREAGRDLDLEVKEGPGGIRDVEFLVQALQLFHGAREPGLHTGNVLEALDALARAEILHADVSDELSRNYIWLRQVEHSLQLVEERQTHRFPRDPEEQTALARRLGVRDEEGATARHRLLDDWTRVRSEVRARFEELVLREEEPGGAA